MDFNDNVNLCSIYWIQKNF